MRTRPSNRLVERVLVKPQRVWRLSVANLSVRNTKESNVLFFRIAPHAFNRAFDARPVPQRPAQWIPRATRTRVGPFDPFDSRYFAHQSAPTIHLMWP